MVDVDGGDWRASEEEEGVRQGTAQGRGVGAHNHNGWVEVRHTHDMGGLGCDGMEWDLPKKPRKRKECGGKGKQTDKKEGRKNTAISCPACLAVAYQGNGKTHPCLVYSY